MAGPTPPGRACWLLIEWSARDGSPAARYCHDLYAEVGTPRWALKAGYFHDRESCEEWYRAQHTPPFLTV